MHLRERSETERAPSKSKRDGLDVRLFLGFLGDVLKTHLNGDYCFLHSVAFRSGAVLGRVMGYTHIIKSTNSACHGQYVSESVVGCSVTGAAFSGLAPHNSILSMETDKSRAPLYTRGTNSPITQTHCPLRRYGNSFSRRFPTHPNQIGSPFATLTATLNVINSLPSDVIRRTALAPKLPIIVIVFIKLTVS